MKDFQAFLRKWIESEPYWIEKTTPFGGIRARRVEYELGYSRVRDHEISISHDDVIKIFVAILNEPKFRQLLVSRHPILFIDEYQDSDKGFAEALKTHFLENESGLLLGFFGDHWQKIYPNVCGKIEHSGLVAIDKKANFRSAKPIVEVLNRMRPDLPQAVQNPSSTGFARVFHTNGWIGVRQSGTHTKGDLPPAEAHRYLTVLQAHLATEGWSFAPDQAKILMLTHNVLAKEQGYSGIADTFEYNDSFTKKEDDHIKFFADLLEPACIAYEARRFGELFAILGQKGPKLTSHRDKTKWVKEMDALIALRSSGNIGQVLSHLRKAKIPRLPESVERKEKEFEKWLVEPEDPEKKSMLVLRSLKEVSYSEVVELTKFITEKTPFATKHGVKGAEFENVLVVLGRGWNHYNFSDFLEWAADPARVPPAKQDAYERNRNLFYVACSRPKKRLALLFTQQLSEKALETLVGWFGEENVIDAPLSG
jgi:DNA helicase-2/ATP-dependent DNA helicase PcrA